ncbi:MAG: transcriptional regulator, TetR family [Porphyrobacter sp. HL-46]|nr:MAG: transcriptional regulator, TetR family [Porphyrobacter sp. HL-46]
MIEAGPQSVTLKAVAGRIGRTHANLLHHFGSASGLQKALAEHLDDTRHVAVAELARVAGGPVLLELDGTGAGRTDHAGRSRGAM